MAGRIGVLLVNVGTPDAPRTPEVRRYLREFLSDPRVVDINPAGRWLLLNAVILPTRPAKSAEAYQKVWMDGGSPLLVHGRAFADGLQQALGPEFVVTLGMRYGNPSLPAALDTLIAAGVERIVVFPMFPQRAASSTGTALARTYALAADRWKPPALTSTLDFYDHPQFIDAFVQRARETFEQGRPDYVLFSFHGLPERHMRKSDPSGRHCLATADCCARITEVNRSCYRAQCFATARLIATRLELADGAWSVAFQSRLGRTPWIKPYTDEVVPKLVADGVKHLAVMCPAFVADCLETLEEIGMRLKEDFEAAGGQALTLVPSLNAHPAWIAAGADIVRQALASDQPAR